VGFSPEPINLRAARPEEYRALNECLDRLRAEAMPEDPPIPHEERLTRWQSQPSFVVTRDWIVWNPERSRIIAHAGCGFEDAPENRHLVGFGISVLPELRRQGLGTRLLTEVAKMAAQAERTLLLTDTNARVPAGQAFVERLGAERGLEAHTNQLLLSDLDPALLRRWLDEAPVEEFELGLWEGPFPEAELGAIAQMIEVAANTEPRENLQVEDFRITPEKLRAWEKPMLAANTERWVIYARERRSGRLAGYSEVFWNPSRPEILRQGGTGVLPEFRGRRLGGWLKAAMLDKVQRERPEVKRVRTGNANSNVPMLRINTQLGFRPYISEVQWQVPLEKVQKYLACKA